MVSKKEAGSRLGKFTDDLGVPSNMVFDNDKEQTGPKSDFMQIIKDNNINWQTTEPYSPWQNRCELMIGLLRRQWKLQMRYVPKRLWDFGLTYEAEIMSRTCRKGDDRTARALRSLLVILQKLALG